jgi:hypothetical protein
VRLVATPGSPALITEAKGRLRVSLRDGDKMVDAGWVDARDAVGLTLVRYDWEERIERDDDGE